MDSGLNICRIWYSRQSPMEYREKMNDTDKVIAYGLEPILDHISSGRSVKELAAEIGVNPGRVIGWLLNDVTRAEAYARAREASAHLFALEIHAVASDLGVDPEDRRIAIDALKWCASRLAPKVFGDKSETTLTVRKELNDAELAAAIGQALGIPTTALADPAALPAPEGKH